jgi:V8-like Glu-specific endopeptidase
VGRAQIALGILAAALAYGSWAVGAPPVPSGVSVFQSDAPSAANVDMAKAVLANAQQDKDKILRELTAQRTVLEAHVKDVSAAGQTIGFSWFNVRDSIVDAIVARSPSAWRLLKPNSMSFAAAEDGGGAGPKPIASDATSLAKQADTARSLAAIADNTAAAAAVNGDTPQDPAELVRVAETIRLANRPVVLLCNGQPWYTSASKPYANWAAGELPAIQKVGRATGLVMLFQINPDKSQTFVSVIGTAVAVGPNTIVTNRHVLESGIGYVDAASGARKLMTNRVAKVSFPYEYSSCSPPATPPAQVSVIEFKALPEGDNSSGQGDYVLLKVDRPLTNFVTFAANDLQNGDKLAVIGYPSRPEEKDTFLTTQQIDVIFQSEDGHVPFPALRAAYGLRMFNPSDAPGTFAHDASTWFGSSGSAIVNLRTGAVVGLQQGGMSGKQEGVAYNIAIDGGSVAKLMAANP